MHRFLSGGKQEWCQYGQSVSQPATYALNWSMATNTATAQGRTSEPPLTRREKLRRTLLLCCHCSRNIAYYRVGWSIDPATRKRQLIFEDQFEITVNGNFIDIAVLEWCKLYGESKREPHHWQRILETTEKQKHFGKQLHSYLGCTRKEWKDLRNKALTYRNEFVAHLGEKRQGDLPFLSYILTSAFYYHEYLIEHENNGHTYRDLPHDPRQYFQDYEAEANQRYASMRSALQAAE